MTDDDIPITTIYWVRNDTQFNQEFVMNDKRGKPVDLTGNSEVRFKMALLNAATNKISGACTVTDAVNGACNYAVQGTELDTAGTYYAEVQVTFPSGRIISTRKSRLVIIVEEDNPAT